MERERGKYCADSLNVDGSCSSTPIPIAKPTATKSVTWIQLIKGKAYPFSFRYNSYLLFMYLSKANNPCSHTQLQPALKSTVVHFSPLVRNRFVSVTTKNSKIGL